MSAVLTPADRALAAGFAGQQEPTFKVAGETFTRADMLAANVDDAATCAWLATAKAGDVLEQMHAETVECVGLKTFDLSGTDATGLKWEFMVSAATSCDAVAMGTARGWNGVQAVLHEPERTAAEGRARFPGRLHPACCNA